MEAIQAAPALTLADLDEQEKTLTQRRDGYVQEANANIAAFNGAIQQVQAQRSWLLEKQKGQEQVEKKGRRQRGKVKRKEEMPVMTDSVTEPGPLADVA